MLLLLLVAITLSGCVNNPQCRYVETTISSNYSSQIAQHQYTSMDFVDADGDGQSELKKYTFDDGYVIYYNASLDTWYVYVCK